MRKAGIAAAESGHGRGRKRAPPAGRAGPFFSGGTHAAPRQRTARHLSSGGGRRPRVARAGIRQACMRDPRGGTAESSIRPETRRQCRGPFRLDRVSSARMICLSPRPVKPSTARPPHSSQEPQAAVEAENGRTASAFGPRRPTDRRRPPPSGAAPPTSPGTQPPLSGRAPEAARRT